MEGLAHHGTEDAMKVKRRETGGLGHHLELERLVEILQDKVDGSVDATHVVERIGSGFFAFVSQEL